MSRPSNENEALDQSAQVIVFCAPVQPCRVPIRRPDGTLVLDFPSERARFRFKQQCVQTVAANCEQGARGACSLRAVDACRGPKWLRWLGLAPRKPWRDIEACEEREMQACALASAGACAQHATRFCDAITRPPK